ncbi:hypothetical protein EB093_03720 [bacterium]|nr:hypothetical protein [bacterium]
MMRLGGIVCVVLVLFCSQSVAQSMLTQSMVKWSAVGVASVADSIGVEAMGINPAGIAQSKRTVLSGYSSQYQDAYSTAILGTSFQLTPQCSMAAVAAIRKIDGIPETIDQGGDATLLGSFSDSETVGKVGIAYAVSPRVVVGMSAGLAQQSVFNETASLYSLDVGVTYDADFARIGVGVQNVTHSKKLWSTGRNDDQPIQWNVGLSTGVAAVRVLGSVSSQDNGMSLNVGAVYPVLENLTVLAGIHDIFKNWSTSVGLDLQLEEIGLIYTFAQSEVLGDTHKLGVEIGL